MKERKLASTFTWIRRIQLAVFIIITLPSYSTAAAATSEASDARNLQRLSRAHLEFALSFFRHVTKDTNPEENIVVSPRRLVKP